MSIKNTLVQTSDVAKSILPFVKSSSVRRWVGAAVLGVEFGVSAWDYFSDLKKNKYKFTVSIPSDTIFCDSVLYELGVKVDESKVSAQIDLDVISESNGRYSAELDRRYHSDINVEIIYKGVPFYVETQEVTHSKTSEIVRKYTTVSTTTREYFDFLEDLMDKVAKNVVENVYNGKKTHRVYRMDSYRGFYADESHRLARPLDSVIIDDETKKTIMHHITTFQNHEEDYARLNIPYHTGIILHGPPGTGKTSLVSSLSAEFGLPTYIVNLSNIESAAKLDELGRDIRKNSIVLLEDVDVVAPNRNGDNNGTSLTLDALLNFIDGISTPYGMITVLTANNIEDLDPALLRPGRFDISAEIGYFSNQSIVQFCSTFVSDNEEFLNQVRRIGSSISEVTGADLMVPVKESIFATQEEKEEHMIAKLRSFITQGEDDHEEVPHTLYI